MSSSSNGKPQRTRTVTWTDPGLCAETAGGASGLEYLRAIRDGKTPQPPIASLLGYTMLEIDEGRVVFGLEPAEYHYNPFGAVHGGVVSTLLDTAMTCAVYSMLPRGAFSSTVELKVNFIRPLTIRTGPVRVSGSMIHVGKRLATAEGKVVDEREKLYAHGVTTCMIIHA